MTKTAFGYLHVWGGLDMDGTQKEFEAVRDLPMKGDPTSEPAWFAKCVVEPQAGWIGPFDAEAEAVKAATDNEAFLAWMYDQAGDDPLGGHHGRNE